MLQALVELIETHFAHLPDYRKASPNQTYSVSDAALSAFAVFMMQAPSFLAQQRDLQRSKGWNNAQSLFGVHEIPSDNQIRDILDPIAPSYLSKLFWEVYEQLQASQFLTQHTGIAGTHLCALDGVYYFSSNKIHCANCTHQEHEGQVSDNHGAIAPVLVAPGSPQVFTLEPEFIQPQDGSAKQDCELNATKRPALGELQPRVCCGAMAHACPPGARPFWPTICTVNSPCVSWCRSCTTTAFWFACLNPIRHSTPKSSYWRRRVCWTA